MKDKQMKHEDQRLSTEFNPVDDDEIEVNIRDGGAEDAQPGEDVDVEPEAAESGAPELHEAVRPETPDEETSLQDRLRDTEDRFLRLAAEFDNYRKRTSRQLALMIDTAQAQMMTELLNIQDNFERALQVEGNSEEFIEFRKGIELIFSQLVDFLKRNGVEPFGSVGERFDPNYHEAVTTVATDDVEEGIVVEEFTKGYMFKDRVLRHARVSVAKGQE